MIENIEIIRRGGCILVSAPISPSVLFGLASELPKGAVMDPNVARMAKAGFAMGMPEDLRKLREELSDQARQDVRLKWEGKGLSEEALEWLAVGEQGLSSVALFYIALGLEAPEAEQAQFGQRYPHDPDDFSRILKLVEAMPGIREKIGVMRGMSPEWSALVANFEEIEALMKAELENGEGRAPRTYDRMKEIYAAARVEDEVKTTP